MVGSSWQVVGVLCGGKPNTHLLLEGVPKTSVPNNSMIDLSRSLAVKYGESDTSLRILLTSCLNIVTILLLQQSSVQTKDKELSSSLAHPHKTSFNRSLGHKGAALTASSPEIVKEVFLK